MDCRDEARDFLQTRRARMTPPSGSRTAVGGRRRVPGLRREEVAQLAGVSVDYYTRLEKGHLGTASYAVLNAVSGALHLDRAERAHLLALARAARGESGGVVPRLDSPVRPGLTWVLDAMTLSPAYVRSGRLEVVASNSLCRALWEPLFSSAEERPNLAAFCFLDPHAEVFFTDWQAVARGTVALLRAEVGRYGGDDEELARLVDRLIAGSCDFRSLWAEHGVLDAFSDTKRFHHPRVGDLALATETQTVIAHPGLTMVAYAAEPGSPSAQALRLLADAPLPDAGAHRG